MTYIYTCLVSRSVWMASCGVSVEISQTVPLPCSQIYLNIWACVMRLPFLEGRVWTLVLLASPLSACSRLRDCNSTTTSIPFADKILPSNLLSHTLLPGSSLATQSQAGLGSTRPKKKSESHPPTPVKKSSFLYSFFYIYIQMRSG